MSAREDVCNLEAVFLEEIARTPGDETPVLIYADWLMEQDDPSQASRGEFLRLQSVLRRGRPGAQRGDMEWRARDLWWKDVETWLGPLYDAVEHFHYERGLLAIEVCEDTLRRFDTAELARTPAWGWVRHIGVRAGSVETLAWLSELPRPPLLASLDVGRKTLDPEGDDLQSLLGLPLLAGLAELELGQNSLGDAGAIQLAAWAGAGSLRKLGLSYNGIGDVGARALAHSAHLNGLVELNLSRNPVADDGGLALAGASGLGGLQRLDLSGTDVGWHEIAALQKRFRRCDIQCPGWRRPHYGGNW
jgi:uncharacterized protein (TIGR02996 family)